jgi:hypothetical protein
LFRGSGGPGPWPLGDISWIRQSLFHVASLEARIVCKPPASIPYCAESWAESSGFSLGTVGGGGSSCSTGWEMPMIMSSNPAGR